MMKRFRFILFIIILSVIFSCAIILCKHFILGINASESLPYKLFLIIKKQKPQFGDYIAFYPPSNSFYSSSLIFIKKMVGKAGDRVTEKQRTFYINGLAIGYAKPVSSKGSILKKGPVGIIPQNHYFVYAPHSRSFDSRYNEMGWISDKNIIGRAFPLF